MLTFAIIIFGLLVFGFSAALFVNGIYILIKEDYPEFGVDSFTVLFFFLLGVLMAGSGYLVYTAVLSLI